MTLFLEHLLDHAKAAASDRDLAQDEAKLNQRVLTDFFRLRAALEAISPHMLAMVSEAMEYQCADTRETFADYQDDLLDEAEFRDVKLSSEWGWRND